MAQKIGDAFVEISAKFDELDKGMNKATSKIDSGFSKLNSNLKNQFTELGKAFAGYFAVQKLTELTVESVKLAAEAEGVKRAFDNLNNPALLDKMRTAVKGTVSDLELMRFAVKASHFKIPLEQLGGFLEFARQRANETGQAMEHILRDLNIAVGRGSIEVWDNFGISLDRVRKTLGGVSVETLTVAQRAELMGRLIKEEMAGAATGAMTAAEEFQKMQADIDNLKVEIGQSLMPVMSDLLGITRDVANGFKIIFTDATTESEQLRKEIEKGFSPQTLAEARIAFKEIRDQMEGQQGTLQAIDGLIRKNNAQAKTYLGISEAVNGAAVKEWLQKAATLKALNELLMKERSRLDVSNEVVKTEEKKTEEIKKSTAELIKAAEAAEAIKNANEQTVFNMGEGVFTPSTDLGPLESPFFDEEAEPFENLVANLDMINQKYQELGMNQQLAAGLATQFGQALTDSFAGALDGSANFFESMGQFLKRLAIQLAAAAAAAFILNSLLGGTGLISGGFKGIFGQLSGLGGGGGFTGGLDFGGVVRGQDIFITNNRATNRTNRFGG